MDLGGLASEASKTSGDAIEIGCGIGLSTIAILDGLPEDRKIHCFDLILESPCTAQEDFDAQLNKVGMLGRVIKHGGDFRLGLPTIDIRPMCFGFVDHDHTLSSTEFAFDYIWKRLTPGGIVAFHDFMHTDYPEPTEFLTSLKHERPICRPGLISFRKT